MLPRTSRQAFGRHGLSFLRPMGTSTLGPPRPGRSQPIPHTINPPSSGIAKKFSTSAGFRAPELKAPKDINQTDGRRKGLAWRAKQRGWLELDWLLGTFAGTALVEYKIIQQQLLEQLQRISTSRS